MYKVYLLEFPNGKKYCGQTKRTLAQRAGSGGIFYKDCPKVWNAIQKYGWENVKKSILQEFNTQEECDDFERKTIRDLNLQDDAFGYNISDGGQGVNSEVVSVALRKRFANPEEREKISQTLKDWRKTDEGKNHIIDLARQNSINFGYGVVQFDLSTGKPLAYFHSYSEAVYSFTGKRHAACVKRVVDGERRSYRGFGWRKPTLKDKIALNLE